MEPGKKQGWWMGAVNPVSGKGVNQNRKDVDF